MKRLLYTIPLLTAAYKSANANEQDHQFYSELNKKSLVKGQTLTPSNKDTSITGVLGAIIAPSFAIEARYGVQYSDALNPLNDHQQPINAVLDSDLYTSLYARFTSQAYARLKPYLLTGYTNLQTKQNANSCSVWYGCRDQASTLSLAGLSYGAGIDFALSDTGKIRFEYIEHEAKLASPLSGIKLGLKLKF